VAALRAYLKACGLCQFCVNKWSHGHQCASTVQLHVIQELWEMLFVDSDTESLLDQSDTKVQLNMILSKEALLVGNSS
jgi:hypothetical protein